MSISTRSSSSSSQGPSSSGASTPNAASRVDPKRFYTAFAVIPVLYFGIAYSPPWLFSLFVGLTAILALQEFLLLYAGHRPSGVVQWCCTLGSAGITFMLHEQIAPAWQWIGLLISAGVLTGFFLNPAAMRRHFPPLAASLFGILYVTLLFGHFILIRQLSEGIAMVFFVLIVTWLADTGGFIIGLRWGRRPLAPMLSPKKTIEGFWGGLLFSLLGALLCHLWFASFASVLHSAALGLFLGLWGTFGDLTESAIKRSVQVKDSGTLIPGHGGVLDRIDSLLLSAPAFYYYALMAPLG